MEKINLLNLDLQFQGGFDEDTYKLVVKAYNNQLGEDKLCIDKSSDLERSYYSSIDINRENDKHKFIYFDKTTIQPKEPTCGENVILKTSLINVGDETIDVVLVTIKNEDLSIYKEYRIVDDLEEGEKREINIPIKIPIDARNGYYPLDFIASYDPYYNSPSFKEIINKNGEFVISVVGCENVDEEIYFSDVLGGQISESQKVNSDENYKKSTIIEDNKITENQKDNLELDNYSYIPYKNNLIIILGLIVIVLAIIILFVVLFKGI